MGKYHVDSHKAALKRNKEKTNIYLNKNKKMHKCIQIIGSILILLCLFGFLFVMPIISIFAK